MRPGTGGTSTGTTRPPSPPQVPKGRSESTYPVVESSRRVAFLVEGQEKAAILQAIRTGTSQVPAARIRPVGELIWFVDQAAVGEERMPSRAAARSP